MGYGSYELQFLIYVNTTLDIEELISSLKGVLTSTRTFYWSGNWVQVWPNEDYDESLISDSEEGFLYYRYRIEVSPIDNDKSVERQVSIAKHLKSVLESLGCIAVICADFEDLL
jgi:hypothetical protein